jgi:cytosine/uracil/thiamine/allantoin permease
MKKPVSPTAHGVIDYVFSGIQLAAPPLLGINSGASITYQALGSGITLINALTNTKAGIKHWIPFKAHQKADLGVLAGLSLLSFARIIRRDKKALRFHLIFLGLAVAHYILTDYNRKR